MKKEYVVGDSKVKLSVEGITITSPKITIKSVA